MTTNSHAARDAISFADTTIARIRARLGESIERGEPDGETADAVRFADAWARYTVDVVAEAKLADVSRSFRVKWPALVKWRERVLKNGRKSKPSVVAAAYELLALECTLAGELHLAAKAQQAAIDVMRKRGVVPIRSQAHPAPAQSA